MIASYHNSHNFLDHHTNRQPFTIDFSSNASSAAAASAVQVQLANNGVTHRSATAHAILMWISFAVIFPAGVIMARYFKVSMLAFRQFLDRNLCLTLAYRKLNRTKRTISCLSQARLMLIPQQMAMEGAINWDI